MRALASETSWDPSDDVALSNNRLLGDASRTHQVLEVIHGPGNLKNSSGAQLEYSASNAIRHGLEAAQKPRGSPSESLEQDLLYRPVRNPSGPARASRNSER